MAVPVLNSVKRKLKDRQILARELKKKTNKKKNNNNNNKKRNKNKELEHEANFDVSCIWSY